jgi:hypothetical protein
MDIMGEAQIVALQLAVLCEGMMATLSVRDQLRQRRLEEERDTGSSSIVLGVSTKHCINTARWIIEMWNKEKLWEWTQGHVDAGLPVCWEPDYLAWMRWWDMECKTNVQRMWGPDAAVTWWEHDVAECAWSVAPYVREEFCFVRHMLEYLLDCCDDLENRTVPITGTWSRALVEVCAHVVRQAPHDVDVWDDVDAVLARVSSLPQASKWVRVLLSEVKDVIQARRRPGEPAYVPLLDAFDKNCFPPVLACISVHLADAGEWTWEEARSMLTALLERLEGGDEKEGDDDDDGVHHMMLMYIRLCCVVTYWSMSMKAGNMERGKALLQQVCTSLHPASVINSETLELLTWIWFWGVGATFPPKDVMKEREGWPRAMQDVYAPMYDATMMVWDVLIDSSGRPTNAATFSNMKYGMSHVFRKLTQSALHTHDALEQFRLALCAREVSKKAEGDDEAMASATEDVTCTPSYFLRQMAQRTVMGQKGALQPVLQSYMREHVCTPEGARECPVCLDALTSTPGGRVLVMLSCGHMLHEDGCWEGVREMHVRRHGGGGIKCPTCRALSLYTIRALPLPTASVHGQHDGGRGAGASPE